MTEDKIFEMLDSLGNEEIGCDEVPDKYWQNHQFCGNIINNGWDSDYYQYMQVLNVKKFWLESLPNYLELPAERDDVAWKIPLELWSDSQFVEEMLAIYPFWKDVYDTMVKNGQVKPAEKKKSPLFSGKKPYYISPKAAEAEKLRLAGVEFRKLGNYEKALASYAKALELTPDNARVYSNRATVYYHQKKYEAAIIDYSKAIELSPKGQLPCEGDYNYNRGAAYKESGKNDLARQDYKKALKLNPDHPYAGEELKKLGTEGKKSGPPPLPSAAPWQNLPPVQYYVALKGKQAGPFDWAKLDGLVKKGDLKKKALVWKEGLADWISADSVDELKILFKK